MTHYRLKEDFCEKKLKQRKGRLISPSNTFNKEKKAYLSFKECSLADQNHNSATLLPL